MACHVYDPNYAKVMTIIVCDMQSKDVESQVFMWMAFIKVMKVKVIQMLESRGSWLIVFKPIGMLFTLCLADQETFLNHCTTKKKLVFSIGFSP